MNIYEEELCPYCLENGEEKVATIDDMGFLGCQDCWDKVGPTVKARMLQHHFDQDGTGQDEEAYYG